MLAALHPNIISGTDSDASQDATVMLLYSPGGGVSNRQLCSGTLVAPRLVLTARHCVAKTSTKPVGCLPNGKSVDEGGSIFQNFPATDLLVFTGRTRAPETVPFDTSDPTKWQPASRGLQIFDDGATNLCDHDLALVVLNAPITNVPIARLRLETEPEVGEPAVAVGYGWTLSTRDPPVRQMRRDVTLRFVGPHIDGYPFVLSNELGFTESICEGDSGGPLLSARSGAVVGVSARAFGSCQNAVNIGTKLTPFRAVIADAFVAAGASPQLEGWDAGGCR